MNKKKETHSFFLAALQGRNHPGLYIATLVVVAISVMLIGQIPLGIALFPKVTSVDGVPDQAVLDQMQSEGFNPEALDMSPALGLLLLIFPFAMGAIALAYCMRFLHNRSWLSLITPTLQMDWKKVFFAGGVWLGLSVIGEGIAYFMEPENYVWTFEAGKFFPVLIVAVLFIPLQSSFEELIFRGYLMQGFGLIFRRAWPAIILTSCMFGLMHIFNPEVQQFGYSTLFYYIGVGLLFGVITVMDEGMEIALGVHAANNIFGATLISFPSSAFQMPTLFVIPEYNFQLMFAFWVVMAGVFYYIMSRKYGWEDYAKLGEVFLKSPTKVTPEDVENPPSPEI